MATVILMLFLVSQVLTASIDTTTIGIEPTTQYEHEDIDPVFIRIKTDSAVEKPVPGSRNESSTDAVRVSQLMNDINSTVSESQKNENNSLKNEVSVLIRKGLEVFSSSEADSTSQMIVPIFSVDSVKFSAPEGKQGCTPTDLCRSVYNTIIMNLPSTVGDVISSIAILPPSTYRLVFELTLAGSGVYAEAFVTCWQCNVQTTFGLDPTAAAVEIEGEVMGDMFFAQTQQREGKPSSITVVGSFTGLRPGQRYRVTVHNSGDIDRKCAFVGNEFSTLGGAFFTADRHGKAVLMMQDTSVLIEGEVSLLGRSIVVTPDNDTSSMSCGVVVRNVIPQERL